MRKEKKYLVSEAVDHLGKSDYLLVVGFDRLTVLEVAELRKSLLGKDAEFHVVKNSVLDLAAKECNFPELTRESLRGTTAIVVGGKDPSEVAKRMTAFANEKGHEDKLTVKCGILEGRALSAQDVIVLSKLPSLGELRAKFLALLQTPFQNFLSVCNAGMQNFVRLLVAHAKE
ncbi:MAG: 50S ribosomal protein L10 [Puniceicoccales bacterium]|jgi:large subunit ribosomal protein L10|nr:50S ribosomal protein L10 [Puniceicoccales bacterium]